MTAPSRLRVRLKGLQPSDCPPGDPSSNINWIFDDAPSNDAPFDAIIMPADQLDPEQLSWLIDSPSPLATLIVVGEARCARVDAAVPALTAESLSAALQTAQAQKARIQALANIPNNQDREGLVALGLMVTRESGIDPVLDASLPSLCHYPMLAGISNPYALMQALANSHLCTRQFFERLHGCPGCQSARMAAREVCPNCASADISEWTLVHHFRCGYQAPRYEFLDEEVLSCPKCHRRLRHFGVDYDTPGQVSACGACHQISDEPVVGFICGDCGEHVGGDEAPWRDWFSYRITPAGEAAAVGGRLPGTSLESALSELEGWRTPRDMRLLLKLCWNLYERYQRPFATVVLLIQRDEDAIAQLGRQGLARLHSLVVELVANTVRTTDGVGILEEKVIICLPETSSVSAETLVKRLRQQIEASLGNPEYVQLEIADRLQIEQLIEQLEPV